MERLMGGWKWAGTTVLSTALLAASVAGSGGAAAVLGVPGHTNAFASIAATRDLVVAGWAATTPEGASDVYAAVSRDGGRKFAAPTRVTRAGGVNASGEQPVRVVLIPRVSGDPAVVIVWTARVADSMTIVTGDGHDSVFVGGGAEILANNLTPMLTRTRSPGRNAGCMLESATAKRARGSQDGSSITARV